MHPVTICACVLVYVGLLHSQLKQRCAEHQVNNKARGLPNYLQGRHGSVFGFQSLAQLVCEVEGLLKLLMRSQCTCLCLFTDLFLLFQGPLQTPHYLD